ncbi:hypothetical protein Y032_0144g2451 [Ancylostoma ceylanicum]|uniref:Uncharacterized protein n=1 Tax=Ancylostoma ceylanicum TaxID=53326 RepID=A0A016T331_9BILA|nr:hypothetical protein Y032_0144g2451 [Ancylostoma ceylanicum]
MLRFSPLGLLLAISATLTTHGFARIPDGVRHRSTSYTWGRTERRRMPLVERSLNSIDDEFDPFKKVANSGRHISLEVASGLSSSESYETFEDRGRGSTIDRSLIVPLRRPISGGQIAYPPVLPIIHGHDRDLPFGTMFVERRKTSRRLLRGRLRNSL